MVGVVGDAVAEEEGLELESLSVASDDEDDEREREKSFDKRAAAERRREVMKLAIF